MYGLSSVAGIIDPEGNVRVVVTELHRFHYHVRDGERIFVVPGLLVQEPVEWGLIPYVIAAGEQAVADGIWPEIMPKRGVPEAEALALLWRTRIVREGLARAA